MKPFNLEAALNGAKVVTRGGKPVTELMKFTTVRPYNLVWVTHGENSLHYITQLYDNPKNVQYIIQQRELLDKKNRWKPKNYTYRRLAIDKPVYAY